MDEPAVTVCIPTIPTRGAMLQRALRSVERQTYPNVQVVIETDAGRTGAAATRQRALERVDTPLVAFLDDDDELWPEHLSMCVRELERTGADLVYPWFEVEGGNDPFPDHRYVPFNETHLRKGTFLPITVVARTDSVRAGGGFQEMTNELGWTCEDYRLWIAMLDQKAHFVHLPRTTWTWCHHGNNTSGNAKRW